MMSMICHFIGENDQHHHYDDNDGGGGGGEVKTRLYNGVLGPAGRR